MDPVNRPELISAGDQAALIGQHRAATLLIGQKKYSAGIRALQAIVDARPELVVVQYQLAEKLAEVLKRSPEKIEPLLRPAAPEVPKPEPPSSGAG